MPKSGMLSEVLVVRLFDFVFWTKEVKPNVMVKRNVNVILLFIYIFVYMVSSFASTHVLQICDREIY